MGFLGQAAAIGPEFRWECATWAKDGDVVAAAMIDRLVHHAEVLTLTGDSYRTRQRRELLINRTAPNAVATESLAERASRQRAPAAAFSSD